MNLKGFIKVSPIRFFMIILLSVIGGGSAIGGGYVQMYWLTSVKNKDWRSVLLDVLVMAIFYLAAQSLIYYVQYLIRIQEETYFAQIRSQVASHYFKDGKFHKVADFQNRLTNDLEQVKINYFELLIMVPFYGAVLVTALAALITIHWSIFAISIVIDLISYFVPKLLQKRVARAISGVSAENKKYLNVLEKWFNGISEMRRFFALDKLIKVEGAASSKAEKANVEQVAAQQALNLLNGICNTVSQLAMYAIAGYLIVRGEILFGAILSVQNFAANVSIGMQQVIISLATMKATKPLMAEIGADATEISENKEESVQTPVAIATENLSLKFPNGEQLSFPDLEIKQGEKILLTGDSGAGKSTLLKIILGDLKPSQGKIIFKNQAGQAVNPDLSKIGYIPQDPNLFPGTIAENITMFNKQLDNQVNKVVNEVNFSADLAKFKDGKNEEIDLDNLNISGGQRQKIVLARAKIHDSEIILIDEGTSAIDQKNTMDILQRLVKTSATIVFIAHNFNAKMKDLFDREIHLVKG